MGVQLELPRSFRDRLDSDKMLFNSFVEALDRAMPNCVKPSATAIGCRRVLWRMPHER